MCHGGRFFNHSNSRLRRRALYVPSTCWTGAQRPSWASLGVGTSENLSTICLESAMVRLNATARRMTGSPGSKPVPSANCPNVLLSPFQHPIYLHHRVVEALSRCYRQRFVIAMIAQGTSSTVRMGLCSRSVGPCRPSPETEPCSSNGANPTSSIEHSTAWLFFGGLFDPS